MYEFLYRGLYGFSNKKGVIIYEPQFKDVFKIKKGWGCLINSLWYEYHFNNGLIIIKEEPSTHLKFLDYFAKDERIVIQYNKTHIVEWVFLDNFNKINQVPFGYQEPFQFGLAISYKIDDSTKQSILIDESGNIVASADSFKEVIGSHYDVYYFERCLFNQISIIAIKGQYTKYEFLFQYSSDFEFKLIKTGEPLSKTDQFQLSMEKSTPLFNHILNNK